MQMLTITWIDYVDVDLVVMSILLHFNSMTTWGATNERIGEI